MLALACALHLAACASDPPKPEPDASEDAPVGDASDSNDIATDAGADDIADIQRPPTCKPSMPTGWKSATAQELTKGLCYESFTVAPQTNRIDAKGCGGRVYEMPGLVYDLGPIVATTANGVLVHARYRDADDSSARYVLMRVSAAGEVKWARRFIPHQLSGSFAMAMVDSGTKLLLHYNGVSEDLLTPLPGAAIVVDAATGDIVRGRRLPHGGYPSRIARVAGPKGAVFAVAYNSSCSAHAAKGCESSLKWLNEAGDPVASTVFNNRSIIHVGAPVAKATPGSAIIAGRPHPDLLAGAFVAQTDAKGGITWQWLTNDQAPVRDVAVWKSGYLAAMMVDIVNDKLIELSKWPDPKHVSAGIVHISATGKELSRTALPRFDLPCQKWPPTREFLLPGAADLVINNGGLVSWESLLQGNAVAHGWNTCAPAVAVLPDTRVAAIDFPVRNPNHLTPEARQFGVFFLNRRLSLLCDECSSDSECDGVDCTKHMCDKIAGSCVREDIPLCKLPSCKPHNCDDKSPCTLDSCGKDGRCAHTPTKGSCTTDNACIAAAGTCNDGACAPAKVTPGWIFKPDARASDILSRESHRTLVGGDWLWLLAEDGSVVFRRRAKRPVLSLADGTDGGAMAWEAATDPVADHGNARIARYDRHGRRTGEFSVGPFREPPHTSRHHGVDLVKVVADRWMLGGVGFPCEWCDGWGGTFHFVTAAGSVDQSLAVYPPGAVTPHTPDWYEFSAIKPAPNGDWYFVHRRYVERRSPTNALRWRTWVSLFGHYKGRKLPDGPKDVEPQFVDSCYRLPSGGLMLAVRNDSQLGLDPGEIEGISIWHITADGTVKSKKTISTDEKNHWRQRIVAAASPTQWAVMEGNVQYDKPKPYNWSPNKTWTGGTMTFRGSSDSFDFKPLHAAIGKDRYVRRFHMDSKGRITAFGVREEFPFMRSVVVRTGSKGEVASCEAKAP